MSEQRLIDANALDSALLTDGLASILIGYPHRRTLTVGEIRGILQRAPTVDPVNHGYWIDTGEDDGNDNYAFHCSACGYSDIHSRNTEVSYCWHCGSQMDAKPPKEDEA